VSAEAWLGIVVAALGLGTVLSTLVQSLRELSKAKFEQVAEARGGEAGLARARRIADDLDGHAAAAALPRTACNLLVAIGMVMWITRLRGVPAPGGVELVYGTLVASVLLWIFGMVLPVSIARHAGESTVYTWSPLLRAGYLLGKPLGALAAGVDEIVRRLSGRGEVTDAEESQEEVLEAVEEAQVEGAMDERERSMIEAVVRMRDKTVAQVMTPRTEIEAIEVSDDLSRVTAAVREIGHSRIPVYEESIDRVAGVFYVKDLMKWLAGEGSRTGKPFSLRGIIRPAMFVPETKPIRELLPEMLAQRTHLAMVADEYGGTAGLITIEDIVEEVFGEIHDEYDQPEDRGAEVKVDAAGGWAELDARAHIREVNAELGAVGVELPESEDYDTVGGFVTVTLGRIPQEGERFRHEGVQVTVLEAEPTRVTRIRVEAASPSATEDEAMGARA
jgi:putative hemolysin